MKNEEVTATLLGLRAQIDALNALVLALLQSAPPAARNQVQAHFSDYCRSTENHAFERDDPPPAFDIQMQVLEEMHQSLQAVVAQDATT